MNKNNYAFIDAQNLYLATTRAQDPWTIDLKRFRLYLEQKHHVRKAFYFFGAYDEHYGDMYRKIENYGYTLIFREHSNKLSGKKKGNVDVDIVFSVMKKLYKQEQFGNVILVSGDGDYKRMVDFLIEEYRFEKLLMPNRQFGSSLYKRLTWKYVDYLDRDDMREKLKLDKKAGRES